MFKHQLVFAIGFVTLLGIVTCCSYDSDCGKSKCCRKMFGVMSSCGDVISKAGERCGGQTMCGCGDGMYCAPDEGGFLNAFKRGNGTCEVVQQFVDGGHMFDL